MRYVSRSATEEAMKTFVDSDLCISCGLCADTCPDIYKLEDVAVVKVDTVPPSLEDCALQAEDNCPTDAISHE